ncbi:chloramphenicol acetyltransferase [Flavobacterium branchiophilum NBRC 15030 = ATCC 35035]|uniref:Chloramphenicol O-acetyltransferase type A n=1 Tax=Flavobacterium branchiophilum TaxID=55197 RepID=A0A2H3KS87_9FLAO|nr:chloramphenicol acetyltransferase [Flavobacterium branchiophilum]OXA82406.1 chloramphenicol acetyltransferase [Flavobacterium branchiophilum NBRC 15030 = ATCC 35035]PDS22280.1 chloramphenicol acetyltransferase [Flavobacterium branchiophilum]TQM39577.1 chloramphenicol O-acetyltransferase type A [Flavobacterium branchiophilum]GEM56076.1 chloramphenicol acetyltransferase [Flavobacterium branchiophilum NBRC 15030 = ATCC 35035]
MRKKINFETWNRKDHFNFFNQMEEPFHGVCVNLDCTLAYRKAKDMNVSFFSFYLHKTLRAVNEIENFRYRIIDDDVYVFDCIDASATVLRSDKTFGFSYVPFTADLLAFDALLKIEMARIETTTGIFTTDYPDNLIHFSVLPWLHFTSLSHARSFSWPDSCPKISFGKMISILNQKVMPVSVHVHHGLVDGYHVGLFLNRLQELFDEQ